MAEFELNEDQLQVQEMTRRFARDELRPIARECDDNAKLPEALLQQVWELGIVQQYVPEEFGGYGMDRSAVDGAIMAEEFAWGDLGLAMGSTAPLLALVPILEAGTDEQKSEWLPAFAGENYFHATAALMEPGISFDPNALSTTATIAGDEATLNGTKCFVPLADKATLIVVYANTPEGVGAFVLDTNTPGFTVTVRDEYMGLRTLPSFTIELKDCKVPLNRRIALDNAGGFARMLAQSRATQSAMAVGVARASFEYARDYAKERHAFGQPIATRQSIAFMLAEMAMEIDAMRLLAWRAAWRLDKGDDATRDAAMAKRYCADKCMLIVDYGVQILGGHGYIREHPVEMWFRNGRAFATAEGLSIV